MKFVSAVSKPQLQSDSMKTDDDDDADDEFVPPRDATGWNIVSHPSVFAEVFHRRHEEDRDCENASNPKVGALGLDNKKKRHAGCD